MGNMNVYEITSRKQMNEFTRRLLKDIHALERMIEEEWFDDSPTHIGAEQEFCIIDSHYKPSPKSLEVLKALNNEDFTTELALFNIENNLPPLQFTGNCLSQMENILHERMIGLRGIGKMLDVDFVLSGILPTIRKSDLELENLTPIDRYQALFRAISKVRGKSYEMKIIGLDELNIKIESAMLESCNTSFQVHYQVNPKDFVSKYNLAQVIAAPVLAISSNSPILFGKRLWSETRIALFQQSIDTRVTGEHIRDRSPRVTFGNDWLHDSIVEMYKEDIVRFRVMMMTDFDQDVMELLNKGQTPQLKALSIHNSTVYRWNRPCYGISPNGKPHLRIENRILPSGPTIVDEISNAAFWYGLMSVADSKYNDVTRYIDFDQAKDNFFSAARDGLNTDFTWLDGKKLSVRELIKEELLPLAEKGLKANNIDEKDIHKYLSIIRDRVETGQTGTQWMINSHAKLIRSTTREEIGVALTSCMLANQKKGIPVHKWKLASLDCIEGRFHHTILVEEFMTTDIFTAQQNDIPELVADMMNWKNVKHIPIEDDKGQLKGLMDYSILLKYYSKKMSINPGKSVVVKDIMNATPITISPEATVSEAMDVMKDNRVDCLPVVKNGKLIGIISEVDFLKITSSLLKVLSSKA
ncbi:MAG: glutamate-cysteine ligase family protein [Bacteroidota bacterium]